MLLSYSLRIDYLYYFDYFILFNVFIFSQRVWLEKENYWLTSLLFYYSSQVTSSQTSDIKLG